VYAAKGVAAKTGWRGALDSEDAQLAAVPKCFVANACYTAGNGNIGDGIAPVKRVVANARYAGLNHYRGNFIIIHVVVPRRADIVGEVRHCPRTADGKHAIFAQPPRNACTGGASRTNAVVVYAKNVGPVGNVCRFTSLWHVHANVGYVANDIGATKGRWRGARNGKRGQTSAAFKRADVNIANVAAKGNRGQALTIGKCLIGKIRNFAAQGNRSEVGVEREQALGNEWHVND